MAVVFSRVDVIANEEKQGFLTSGIPREYDDLEGCGVFDDFVGDMEEGTEVKVHVEAYCYGIGEANNATESQLDTFGLRSQSAPCFLSAHCKHIEDVDFAFRWEPQKYVETEMM